MTKKRSQRINRIVYLSSLFFSLCLALPFVSGCSASIEEHGYIPQASKLLKLKVGLTKDEVSKLMGTPSIMSLDHKNTWYYVWGRYSQFVYHETSTVGRAIFAVHFGRTGNLTSVQTYNLRNVYKFDTAQTQTPAFGYSSNGLEQFLKNIGRFKTSVSPST